jgi:hypothetical protein
LIIMQRQRLIRTRQPRFEIRTILPFISVGNLLAPIQRC